MNINRIYRWPALLLLLVGFLTTSASAQTRERAARALKHWAETQQIRVTQMGQFEVTEVRNHVMNAGFGRRSMHMRSRVHGNMDAWPPKRDLLSMRVNGKAIEMDAAARYTRRFRSSLRPEIMRILDVFELPVMLFDRFKPKEPPIREDRDGRVFWKLNAKLKDRPGPPVTLTAWFSDEDFRLLTTRTRFQLPGRSGVNVRTTYERIHGIDLPVLRQIEGSFPVRRRARMFNLRFTHTVRYVDYRFPEL